MKHRLSGLFKLIKTKSQAIIKFMVRFFVSVFLPRLILILSIPLILINVFCAIIILIKNWSLKHTRELNV